MFCLLTCFACLATLAEALLVMKAWRRSTLTTAKEIVAISSMLLVHDSARIETCCSDIEATVRCEFTIKKKASCIDSPDFETKGQP